MNNINNTFFKNVIQPWLNNHPYIKITCIVLGFILIAILLGYIILILYTKFLYLAHRFEMYLRSRGVDVDMIYREMAEDSYRRKFGLPPLKRPLKEGEGVEREIKPEDSILAQQRQRIINEFYANLREADRLRLDSQRKTEGKLKQIENKDN